MAYRVSLSAPAENDAYAAFERIRQAAGLRAEKWLVPCAPPSAGETSARSAELMASAIHQLGGYPHPE
jgi:hypothetical protein